MKPYIVVYHGPTCLDGNAAALAMYNVLGDDADYVIGTYQSEPNIDQFEYKTVFMVDFCYPPEVMRKIVEVAPEVILLDHHVRSYEACRGIVDLSNCSEHRSGAILTLDYLIDHYHFVVSDRTYYLYECIQDRDLWKWEIAASRAITTRLYAEFDTNIGFASLKPMLFNDTGIGNTVSSIIKEGELLLKVHMKDVNNAIKYCRRSLNLSVDSHIWDVPMVNCDPKLSSDVGNILSMDYPFAVTYSDKRDYREFSLRSNKENPDAIDVSYIAKYYGGGGHRHASGFKVPRDHKLAQV